MFFSPCCILNRDRGAYQTATFVCSYTPNTHIHAYRGNCFYEGCLIMSYV